MFATCPVCGYPELREHYRDACDICLSCGFQFGYDDDSEGFTYEQWREKWIKEGMKFLSPEHKPKNWDPKKQLLNIGVRI